MILLIDNYDSFTFNLVHALEALGEEVSVARNDDIDLSAIERRRPEILVISPGPGSPERAGVSIDAIRASLGRRPILGVCLGHQALGAAFGARIVRARRLVHGKAELVEHNGKNLFVNIDSPIPVARYHSLVIDEATLPAEIAVLARSRDGDVMAIEHKHYAAAGVQFHPESYLTPAGSRMLANFLAGARAGRAEARAE